MIHHRTTDAICIRFFRCFILHNIAETNMKTMIIILTLAIYLIHSALPKTAISILLLLGLGLLILGFIYSINKKTK